MRILHLTLKRKWFDLIATGKKNIEYREFKLYWKQRLYGAIFDEVHFKNGYRKDAPFMRVSSPIIRIIHSRHHRPVNGEELTADRYFAIYLGDVLETKNYNNSLEQTP